jgi:hypothetical protein
MPENTNNAADQADLSQRINSLSFVLSNERICSDAGLVQSLAEVFRVNLLKGAKDTFAAVVEEMRGALLSPIHTESDCDRFLEKLSALYNAEKLVEKATA